MTKDDKEFLLYLADDVLYRQGDQALADELRDYVARMDIQKQHGIRVEARQKDALVAR